MCCLLYIESVYIDIFLVFARKCGCKHMLSRLSRGCCFDNTTPTAQPAKKKNLLSLLFANMYIKIQVCLLVDMWQPKQLLLMLLWCWWRLLILLFSLLLLLLLGDQPSSISILYVRFSCFVGRLPDLTLTFHQAFTQHFQNINVHHTCMYIQHFIYLHIHLYTCMYICQ